MNPLTTEWISKAEADFATASREIRARICPNYDAVCFHCQQCVEKYLKALLQEADVPFDRTHNLVVLLDVLRPVHSDLALLRPELHALSTYAIHVRYPGESADVDTARHALRLCRAVRKVLRAELGLVQP
ncbi:HEPN domain-containing protein [Candidatus Fermentibacteria bacterium]|nr:HEPN domain-containing protein [Candidatus Fermentibacteria bacterium]